jgi:hypothetical protein
MTQTINSKLKWIAAGVVERVVLMLVEKPPTGYGAGPKINVGQFVSARTNKLCLKLGISE